MLYPDDAAAFRARVLKGAEDSRFETVVCRIRVPDGGVRWVEFAGQFLSDGVSGKPKRLLSVVRDITDSKLTESVLRESEERFRTMANSAPVFIGPAGPMAF